MAVWKRKWKTSLGEEREAWVIEYRDGNGKRHLETFARKKDADARQAEVKVDVRAGVHVAPSESATVAEAGESWIKAGQAAGLERATIKQYREHVDQHIVPLIGRVKLSNLNVPTIRKFEDNLREGKRSPAMIRKVMTSLGSILADAQEQGLAARNAVRDLRRNRKRGKEHHAEKRQKGKLKIGVDIPTPREAKEIIDNAGRWRPLLITAIFTGLRASELRGLTWANVDLKKSDLHVRQRADRFNEIGKPKSHAGERSVPLPKIVTNTLKEWKLACPPGDLDLVFPNGAGKVESLANIINRGLIPTQVAAGVVTADGKAKYTGMHALRHFYASWCINRTKDGGLGLPPKNVQDRLGHASITITLDRYGHLFKGDDVGEIDVAANALLA
jgi:integrase